MAKTRSSIITSPEHSLPFQPKYDSTMVNCGCGKTPNQSLYVAIATYSDWFGVFPHPQFTIVESYFGWNGNECSGLVMIDERVFAMPHLSRNYVEYLVSHET